MTRVHEYTNYYFHDVLKFSASTRGSAATPQTMHVPLPKPSGPFEVLDSRIVFLINVDVDCELVHLPTSGGRGRSAKVARSGGLACRMVVVQAFPVA